ncbi:MAG: lysozyme, partial [Candidatus Promineifilaceae bacterium]
MTNQLTTRIALEVASHEAIIRQAYKDSVGVWTWSVGLTSMSGHNVERYIGKPQPLKKCLEVFLWALERYADDVREAFAGHSLSDEEFAAALSFHWNTGAIKKASWVKQWKSGQIAAAKKSFMNY